MGVYHYEGCAYSGRLCVCVCVCVGALTMCCCVGCGHPCRLSVSGSQAIQELCVCMRVCVCVCICVFVCVCEGSVSNWLCGAV